jgi:hypothetical protein
VIPVVADADFRLLTADPEPVAKDFQERVPMSDSTRRPGGQPESMRSSA